MKLQSWFWKILIIIIVAVVSVYATLYVTNKKETKDSDSGLDFDSIVKERLKTDWFEVYDIVVRGNGSWVYSDRIDVNADNLEPDFMIYINTTDAQNDGAYDLIKNHVTMVMDSIYCKHCGKSFPCDTSGAAFGYSIKTRYSENLESGVYIADGDYGKVATLEYKIPYRDIYDHLIQEHSDEFSISCDRAVLDALINQNKDNIYKYSTIDMMLDDWGIMIFNDDCVQTRDDIIDHGKGNWNEY